MKLEYLIEHMPEDIKRQTTHKVFLPGESLMRKGERATHVYLLTRGSTRVSNEFASGQRYTFASLDTPDLIGDLEVLSGQGAYAASNEAVTTCEVIAMSAETFLQWMRMDSEFALTVAQMLAAKMYPTSNEAGRVKFLPSLERLHSYLIKRLGTIEADTFILHTSRQQIADDIGTSVKTVNRGVAKLKEAGLIGLLHGKISINKEQQKALHKTFHDLID
ncbi:Crp/Fnr family transcriptional regulator [Selenomonas caprae]|jgi:CRP/FNR family cyclic AMP-dependent transcriptional regulator|uniref:CRP/FNR family transcriptional regulator, cyclic AMP receptor protein n=3 Tax=Selenomonas TaxID=970 RepID=A0A1I3I4P6_SELRU|nr:Crp/Fnr family transcriptional regulator [Selenomonas caprae]MBQ1890299.1 Crp/Fnr family transcriptional regulator [Selenomonas sp.]TYZ28546.1 Crp/Fnr family transcriptional regulator [Selenomonas caprae]SFI42955.1 CRP/FNR family transcriptional regulator, cyclic AMP receptor protein [Selenomonas ruminantium]